MVAVFFCQQEFRVFQPWICRGLPSIAKPRLMSEPVDVHCSWLVFSDDESQIMNYREHLALLANLSQTMKMAIKLHISSLG